MNATEPDIAIDPKAGISVRDRVRGDKLALLYRQSLLAAVVSLSVAVLLATIFWADADHHRVIAWLALVLVSSVLRTTLFVMFRRAGPHSSAILGWERPYLMTLMLSALIWGLGSVWAMPKDSLLHEAVTFGFLIGMAGGALSVYSAIRALALATIATILLPIVLLLVSEGGLVRICIALASVLFFLSALRATRVLSTALEQSFELTYALQEAKEAAERLASTDVLTGLINRRAFFEQAVMPLHFCQRNRQPISAMLLDIDHFKRINDAHGHAIGDLALQHVAQILHAVLRKSDICCRLGGEEFAVLLPDTALEDARAVAEKLRSAIADSAFPIPVPLGTLSITTSIGVAEGAYALQSLLDRADAAMYEAKKAGRNKVVTMRVG